MTAESVNAARVPIAEGMIHIPESRSERPHLIGSRCLSCEEVHFPRRVCCRRCAGMDMETVSLSRRGTLYSFTTVLVKLPGAKTDPPYCVGVVELPEGERLRTLLATEDGESLVIGSEMELVVDVVYTDDMGREVLGWKFAALPRVKE